MEKNCRRIISQIPRRCNEDACFYCALSVSGDKFVRVSLTRDRQAAQFDRSRLPLARNPVYPLECKQVPRSGLQSRQEVAAWGLLLRFDDVSLFLRASVEAVLPFRSTGGRRDLHGRHLVLGAVGSPIAVFRRHHIRAGFGIVEGRVYDAGLNCSGWLCDASHRVHDHFPMHA